jgi:predicted XRE-type DNA-binding protein
MSLITHTGGRKVDNEIIPTTKIENRIFTIRNQKVMIDRDLAELYEVPTSRLNQAVKRNIERFPEDFMFKITDDELKELITNCDRFQNLKHSSSAPYAFTEQGVAMLATVLNSKIAININIQIMRAFVKLRHFVLSQPDVGEQIAELRKLLLLYIDKNDERVNDIIIALNNLIEKPRETKRIGFNPD